MEPMLCSPVAGVPEGPEYLCEPKYDGWRTLLEKRGKGDPPTARSRTGKLITGVPYIIEALKNLPDGTILDGEIVDLASETQWNRTQKILSRKKPHEPDLMDGRGEDPPLTFVVFDLLELNGQPLLGETLEDRKKLLHALFALLDKQTEVIVRPCPELPCTDESLMQLVGEGWEGVVIKDRGSRYIPGARNGTWLKCKPDTEIEVQITGMYAPDTGSKYEGVAVGGFEFSYVQNEGKLINRKITGKCGTGMDDALRREMHEDPNSFIGRIAEVKHWGIGAEGALRFPSLKRIRDLDDKAPEPVELNLTNPTKGTQLLEKMLSAEEDRDTWKARAETAERKLQGFLAKEEAKGSRAGGRRIRNYQAMTAAKLTAARSDLMAGAGPAYDTCIQKGSGDPARDLRVVEDLCSERGL